jgi:hypothetical protein
MILIAEAFGPKFYAQNNEGIKGSRDNKHGRKYPNRYQIPNSIVFVPMKPMTKEKQASKQQKES